MKTKKAVKDLKYNYAGVCLNELRVIKTLFKHIAKNVVKVNKTVTRATRQSWRKCICKICFTLSIFFIYH